MCKTSHISHKSVHSQLEEFWTVYELYLWFCGELSSAVGLGCFCVQCVYGLPVLLQSWSWSFHTRHTENLLVNKVNVSFYILWGYLRILCQVRWFCQQMLTGLVGFLLPCLDQNPLMIQLQLYQLQPLKYNISMLH